MARKLQFPADFQIPTRNATFSKASLLEPYDAWKSSREVPEQPAMYLVPGAQRPLTLKNAKLAYHITRACSLDFFRTLWLLNPLRTTLMMALDIVRSLFPAFRGYSQALIIDELQSLIASESFTWSRLIYLVSTEVARRVAEGYLDSLAASNERAVLNSARLYIEHTQLAIRVNLDVPTLADPDTRVLLQEADLFANSFGSGGFGMLSPLEFIRVFSHLTEIASHLVLIVSLTRGASHLGILALSLFSTLLPVVLSWFSCAKDEAESNISVREARAYERQERMRNFVYSEVHRPEIALFGLGNWILKTWLHARKTVLSFEQPTYARNSSILEQFNLIELVWAIQNIPVLIALQSASTSLGSLTVYRSSVQSLIFAFKNLLMTTKMAFHGIFLMSAFTASKKIIPKLNPRREDMVHYTSTPGGASIVASGLSYTYPGSDVPALKDINFSLQAGETLAIVGYNGSGKSTLANILLRIIDYDKGSLLVNGVDVRRYNPADYHSHLSGVFQSFSKFTGSVRKNVGLGNVDKMKEEDEVLWAIKQAEAEEIVKNLPFGLKTRLQTPGFEMLPVDHYSESYRRHGLSGGEWQRIALARAFMRAREPGVDLLLFDEPTSALDAQAQNLIFNTLKEISHPQSGDRKTVIFITHQLSTARRADKIAMMEGGTIIEFGTHEELLERNGKYASLYRDSV
ncbi:P-loop containing nucleoside triphosphate hydrolase protein [Agrocybe pediades]|nr:P-loop containing nucleoside triphosphate hydrolase protein [Agrocybe pediades]